MAKFKSVIGDFKKVKQALAEEAEKKGGQDYTNPNMFKPQRVKGEEKTKFRIRFLPVGESKIGKPWVSVRYHMFEREGDKRFVKVIDPKTFSRDAKNPIAEYATKLWNSDNAMDKERAKKMFSKERWFTLIYVKEAPENQKEYVGKVMIWEIGKQVFDILDAAIKDYDKYFWDPFKGTDFQIMIKGKGGENDWPDYTMSGWIGGETPIVEDEKEMDRIATELETMTVKANIIDKDGVKTAAELEELLFGGLKVAEKSESEGESLTEDTPSKPVVEKPSKPAGKSSTPDFGDANVAATPKKEVVAKKEEKKTEPDEMDFNIDDIDIKM